MSDHDAQPDPMDKAYAEAEAVLHDEAERAARRARVLAAVARPSEAPQDARARPARPLAWRQGGWLVAASVAVVSVLVALRFDPPPVDGPPPSPPAAQVAPAQPPATAPAVAPPAPAISPAPPPATVADAAPAAARRLAEPPARARPDEVVVTGSRQSAELQEAPVIRAPPPPEQIARPAPPPPPPPPPPSQSFGRMASPPAAPRPPAAAKSEATVEELVVTERALDSLGGRLRAAAAAGRTAEVERLLDRGVPIDAADDDGETALMKSVQAERATVAALLRRRGASLDLRNDAGVSARDMAAATDDAELKRALDVER